MQSRDIRDLVSGGVLALMGVLIAAHSILNLNLGTIRQMGAGMFPLALGVVLALCGGSIFITGLKNNSAPLRISLREPLFVALSISAFALGAPVFGLIPAVFLLVVISTFAEGQLSVLRTLLLGVGLSALCYLLFKVLMGLTMPMFDWRF